MDKANRMYRHEFVNNFAKQTPAEALYKDVEKNDELEGGEIYIVVGNYFSDNKLFLLMMEDIDKDEAKPVDILHCIPSSMVDRYENKSTVGKKLHELGFDVWDAITDLEKKSL